MNDVTLIPTAWIRTVAFAVAALVILLVFQFCHRPDPSGLPAAVQTALITHQVKTVVDTAEVSRLKRAARTDSIREDTVKRQAAESRAAAKIAQRQADSLATIAAQATTAADSARYWHNAYVDEKVRADNLDSAAAAQSAATVIADRRVDTTSTAVSIETGRANRGDSVIANLVPLAENREGCRIPGTFGLLHCPSRAAVAVAAVITGAVVGYEAGKGNIKMPRLPGLSQARVNIPVLTLRF